MAGDYKDRARAPGNRPGRRDVDDDGNGTGPDRLDHAVHQVHLAAGGVQLQQDG
jgi:hypothetical protein